MRPAAHAALAIASAVTLSGAGLVASRGVPDWEMRQTRWLCGRSNRSRAALWPVMQIGSLPAPILTGTLLYRHCDDRRPAAISAGAGVMAWVGAKAVKRVVRRGRPAAYDDQVIPGENTRDSDGFVSGHAAVAASLAVSSSAFAPGPVVVLLSGAAVLAGLARVELGVHLPLDVVGGWALGVLCGQCSLMWSAQ